MASFNLIDGALHSDDRGALHFFNAFDLTGITRMYGIAPKNTTQIRAWQGHRHEKKWFYCTVGSFCINLVRLDNFDNPSRALTAHRIVLDAKVPRVLAISGGYANGFRALEDGAKLMVFSNFTLNESKNDDLRYPLDTWAVNW